MAEYYATAFETGSSPATQKDKILSGKTSSRAGELLPIGYVIHVPSFHVQESVTLTLISGSTTRCFDIPSGATKFKLLCNPGAQSANLSRDQAEP